MCIVCVCVTIDSLAIHEKLDDPIYHAISIYIYICNACKYLHHKVQ